MRWLPSSLAVLVCFTGILSLSLADDGARRRRGRENQVEKKRSGDGARASGLRVDVDAEHPGGAKGGARGGATGPETELHKPVEGLEKLGWFIGENGWGRHYTDTHTASTHLDLLGMHIPFSWVWVPSAWVSVAHPSQSFSARPSSMLTIGYLSHHAWYIATISALDFRDLSPFLKR